jgi:two-component system, NtrC family, sensor histidine kinase PilS
LLFLLHGSLYAFGMVQDSWPMLVCAGYLGVALAVRMAGSPMEPGLTFDPQWVSTIGVDVVAFSALQFLQAGGLAYAPLFALPVLLASVLGSMLLGLGAAAGVTLVLLADGWLTSLLFGDTASRLLQSALAGTGLFALALLTHQLSARLMREERAALRNQQAARVQIQVNQLVIETFADGVLVVDANAAVRAVNPAARRLLDAPAQVDGTFALTAHARWLPLLELARRTLAQSAAQQSDVAIEDVARSPRRIHVRTRLAATHEQEAETLCVMFLQDLREVEARLRTEKLAAMGRMSVAVAHEIRNPLTAIVQANALLDEDLEQPAHKQLSLLVRQNARRLSQIVEEILDVSRVHDGITGSRLALDEEVPGICADWGRQTASDARLRVHTQATGVAIAFESEHLRRVLVNLLDNALRYAGCETDSIQVNTLALPGEPCSMLVWSDGPPLEQTVEQHLFEPFFSSESRSSGLGLYICRELCERNGALIGYRRTQPSRTMRGGNEFFISFRAPGAAPLRAAAFDTILA